MRLAYIVYPLNSATGRTVLSSNPQGDKLVADEWSRLVPQVDFLVSSILRMTEHGRPPDGTALVGDDAVLAPLSVATDCWRLIEQAASHLHACRELVVNNVAFEQAPASALLRACFESGATAFWLLYPANRNERLSRYLRWRVKDAREQQEAVITMFTDQRAKQSTRQTSTRPEQPTFQTELRAHVQQIIDIAHARPGLDHVAIKSGSMKPSQAIQEVSKLVPTQFPLHFLWQEASAHAHGRPWADIGWGVVPLDENNRPRGPLIPLLSPGSRTMMSAMAAITLLHDTISLFAARAGVPPVDGFAERRRKIQAMFA